MDISTKEILPEEVIKKSCEMDDEEMDNFVCSLVIPPETMRSILSRKFTHYARLFYFLSKKFKTLSHSHYNESYLSELRFGEEELYYIYEGCKMQLQQNFYDFYYCVHRLIKTPYTPISQRFILYIIEENDFRFREYLFNHLTQESKNLTSTFIWKILRYILDSKVDILIDEVKSRGVVEISTKGIYSKPLETWYQKNYKVLREWVVITDK